MKISEKPFPQIISQEIHDQLREHPKLFRNLSNDIRSNREVVLKLFEQGINVAQFLPSDLTIDSAVMQAALERFPNLGGSRSFMLKALHTDLSFIRFAKTTLLEHPKFMRSLIAAHPALEDQFNEEFKADPRFETILLQSLKRHNTAPSPVQPAKVLRRSIKEKTDEGLRAILQ